MKRNSSDDEMIRRFLLEAPGDEEETEGETDETEGDDDAGDAEEEKAEETEESTEDQESSFLDSEIEAVLIDFETKARTSAAEEIQPEGLFYKKGMSILLEEEKKSSGIDAEIFAGELARLIKNYDNLLDIKSLLIKKAESFLSSKYEEDIIDSVMDSLETKHGIKVDPQSEERFQLSAPIAVGASGGGGGSG